MLYKNGIQSENNIPKYYSRTIYIHFTGQFMATSPYRRKGKKKIKRRTTLNQKRINCFHIMIVF